MTFYDYKVVPAPKQLKRVKRVTSTAELFCATLSEAINTVARDGWEYVRAETLPATEQGGLFRRGAEVIETVLVFRRPREALGPRLASQRDPAPEPDAPHLGPGDRDPADRDPADRSPADRSPADRSLADRGLAERPRPTPVRREPRFGEASDASKPLRPVPRLGPADLS